MTLLNVLYDQLDFKSGSLFSATDSPQNNQNSLDWLEKGEWLSAAKRAGAKKIFFIDNNPVAVFAECDATLEEKVKTFNKAWCLARPRLLFLASPNEITVYDLAQKPIDENNQSDWSNLKHLKHLKVLHDLKKVVVELQSYHRDNVESGRLFADKRFGDLKNRADKALIRDLKTVRRELVAAGLGGKLIRFAHALIGRAIFIRYLEDRGILTEDYFLKIAGEKTGWIDLLSKPVNQSGADLSEHKTFFPRVLQNKAFTYGLFKKLAKDFNGDMFPDVEEEEQIVDQNHLNTIQDLLYGNVGIQKKLFFYSYQFDIVPLDLISSIYEEFYHGSATDDEKKNKMREDGAYYTPPVLAEFVISRILTPDVLKKFPRIIDPACGSGIFLVEAFRRIVRYAWHNKGGQLTFDELKDILKNQISGIEVSPEAARITAFSLYLSMLHYLDPPAIDQQLKMGNRLPNLIATSRQSPNHFHCILPQNAFDVSGIETNPAWKERFANGCADVVVGNPPWGAPGTKVDADIKARENILLHWCESKNNPIGDKEPSQAFLWRALDLLKPHGIAGMLVSAGVLFKHGPKTQQFRKQWLNNVRLEEVFNFSHVRKFFFKEGISPFLSVLFSKGEQDNKPVYYWSAKQTITVNKIQAIALSKYDRHILWNEDLMRLSSWKEFWFGRLADRKFLDYLKRNPRLGHHLAREESGQGFTLPPKENATDTLKPYKNLVISTFSRYDSLSFTDPPDKVHRLGRLSVYDGNRILVKRGIDEKMSDKGRIVARYNMDPFCFSNAINGIKLKSSEEWKYKIILGILWSSVARYYFFMTSSNWGLWHHEIHLDDELLQLPIILDRSHLATKKIIAIVDKLQTYHPQERSTFHPDGVFREEIESLRSRLEAELDEAVFELYELNDEQKDLIYDFRQVTLPFFYKPFDSPGAMKAVEKEDLTWIKDFIHIFCRRWNPYLGNNEQMRGQVHIGAHDNMVAIEFYATDKGDPKDLKIKDNSWSYILEQIGEALPHPTGVSQIINDGFAYIVSDTGIIIIKRNEKRFWTRSMAREDADSTIYKRMRHTMPEERRLH